MWWRGARRNCTVAYGGNRLLICSDVCSAHMLPRAFGQVRPRVRSPSSCWKQTAREASHDMSCLHLRVFSSRPLPRLYLSSSKYSEVNRVCFLNSERPQTVDGSSCQFFEPQGRPLA
jgi:hypothetical protein